MQTRPSPSRSTLRPRPAKPRPRSSGTLILSLAINIIFGSTLLCWFLGDRHFDDSADSIAPEPVVAAPLSPTPKPIGSPTPKLNYDQWLDILSQEAKAIAKKKPETLMVLAGDSLSLWFPAHLLPKQQTWLNQGISGESANGLLKRLHLFAQTKPKAVFVMIGINDLLKEATDDDLLDRYQQIVQTLKTNHPDSTIVVQSILPRGSDRIITTERRQQLLAISNDRILKLNRSLAKLATATHAAYLDLNPAFTDEKGFLRSELTTDGLHLSQEGYLVWRSALQTFNQAALQPE